MGEIVDVLLGARDLVASGWVQNAFAIDASGVPVLPEDSEAIAWCISGAIRASSVRLNVPWEFPRGRHAFEYTDQVLELWGDPRAIYCFNDDKGRTQQEVIELLDQAARLAKEADE